MKFFDRFYWFRYNLIRFFVIVLCLPFEMVIFFLRICKTLLITDGSEVLRFPWEDRND
jgi:hypothetical protein